tara:strand:+ start:294 stop:509 length:216 start_codon:yes stop_codon:yes gene_type:complete
VHEDTNVPRQPVVAAVPAISPGATAVFNKKTAAEFASQMLFPCPLLIVLSTKVLSTIGTTMLGGFASPVET